MVTSLEYDIRFDRRVDKKKHYISPGGYEIKTKDNVTIGFDFEQWEGDIENDDPHVVHVLQRYLDTDAFPDATKLDDILRKGEISEVTEWFIYTGEYDEPALNPVAVNHVIFSLSDGCSYELPRTLIDQINRMFLESLTNRKEKK